MSATFGSLDGSVRSIASGPQVSISAADGVRSAGIVGTATDTAGTITVQAEEAGPLVHVSFNAPYPGSVVVQLSAMTDAAALCGLYVTASSTSFTVHAASAPGNTVTFSYTTTGVLA